VEFKPVEDDIGLGHHHRFSYPTVEADAKSEQPQKSAHFQIKLAVNREEVNGVDDEGGEQKGVDVVQGRIAEPVILVKHAQAGDQEPDECQQAKDPEGQDDGQGSM